MGWIDGRRMETNPVTGIVERFWYDDVTGQQMISYEQDVTALVEVAKAQANCFDERARWNGNAPNKVASIPYVVLQQLQASGIAYDQQRLRTWLDDSDNKVFRTRPGTLSR